MDTDYERRLEGLIEDESDGWFDNFLGKCSEKYKSLNPEEKKEADANRVFAIINGIVGVQLLSERLRWQFTEWFMVSCDRNYVKEGFCRYLDWNAAPTGEASSENAAMLEAFWEKVKKKADV